MPDLSGEAGELSFKVQITRAETGKVEEFTLVGKITEAQLKELTDGGNALDGSTERCD